MLKDSTPKILHFWWWGQPAWWSFNVILRLLSTPVSWVSGILKASLWQNLLPVSGNWQTGLTFPQLAQPRKLLPLEKGEIGGEDLPELQDGRRSQYRRADPFCILEPDAVEPGGWIARQKLKGQTVLAVVGHRDAQGLRTLRGSGRAATFLLVSLTALLRESGLFLHRLILGQKCPEVLIFFATLLDRHKGERFLFGRQLRVRIELYSFLKRGHNYLQWAHIYYFLDRSDIYFKDLGRWNARKKGF